MKRLCKLCDEPVDKGRWALGRNTCLECGEILAREVATQRRKQIAPVYNKGAYQYITENDLLDIGR
jgi:predicted nucleic acid-binding Zn ribbon protein|tara:strand:- start:7 stop:204 length:198 start_codon:yes stop_codon:yes gene_type:complete